MSTTRPRSLRPHRAVRLLAAVGLGIGIVAAASAQSTDSKPADNTNVLAGPKVEQNAAAPGTKPAFGDAQREGKDRADRLPPRAMMRALDETIFNSDSPADVQATPEQKSKIREIRNAFMDQVRAFHDEHEDEIRQIRREIREKMGGRPEGPGPGRHRGPGGPERAGGPHGPDDMPPPPPPHHPPHHGDHDDMRGPGDPHGHGPDDMGRPKADNPEVHPLREKLRALMEHAPKPDASWQQIWALLSEPQRAAVQKELDAFQAQRDERRAKWGERRRHDGPRPDRHRGGPDGQPGPEGRGGPGPRERLSDADRAAIESIPPEKRRELLRKFSELSKEEQDTLLESMGKSKKP